MQHSHKTYKSYKALYVHRLIFIAIISFIYLIEQNMQISSTKLFLVLVLFIISLTVGCLYPRHCKNKRALYVLLSIDTAEVALLLTITGGLNSPYLWYALNPIIAAGYFLPLWSAVIPFSACILAAIIDGVIIRGQILLAFLLTHIEEILLLTLTTLTIQLILWIYHDIRNKSEVILQQQFILASLYEAVEAVTSHDGIQELVDLFATYAKTLTKCSKAICFIDPFRLHHSPTEETFIFSVSGKKEEFPEDVWYPILLSGWTQMLEDSKALTKAVDSQDGNQPGRLICTPVRSRLQVFGMLATLQPCKKTSEHENRQTLSFLANLAGVAIERNIREQWADKIMVQDEQNRIASEIHDSISQNLFSIVYGMDALLRQGKLDPEGNQQLSTIRNLTSQTAKDLRYLVYRLTPHYHAKESFVTEMQAYLHNVSEINRIPIRFTVVGSEEFMNTAIKKAFYRIVSEAVSNAMRHSHCSSIDVLLSADPFTSSITIKDDGDGFDTKTINSLKHARGVHLGLKNMQKLTLSLRGEYAVESSPGQGTTIISKVPTIPIP